MIYALEPEENKVVCPLAKLKMQIFETEVETLYRFRCLYCAYTVDRDHKISDCPNCGKKQSAKRAKEVDDSWRIRVDRSQ